MAAGDNMFVLPPKSIQLGDRELEVAYTIYLRELAEISPGMVTECREATDQTTNQLSRGRLNVWKVEIVM